MKIIRMVNGKPEVVGGKATSFDRPVVEAFFGTKKCGIASLLGEPVWCLDDQATQVRSYWHGKGEPAEKVFT
jgi:hypothetical protein